MIKVEIRRTEKSKWVAVLFFLPQKATQNKNKIKHKVCKSSFPKRSTLETSKKKNGRQKYDENLLERLKKERVTKGDGEGLKGRS